MKMKIISILLIAFTLTLAQDFSKGSVSCIFNEEEINVPVKSVMLKKENKINLSIYAENSNKNINQNITFEFTFNKLDTGKGTQELNGTMINIQSRNAKAFESKELYLNIGDKGAGRFSFEKKNERITLEMTSLAMKLDFYEFSYKDGHFVIKGTFSGTFRSSFEGTLKKDFVEIKNGKIEVII